MPGCSLKPLLQRARTGCSFKLSACNTMLQCGLAYNVRWTVGSEAMFKGDKE